jgi:plasmid stabilization system protein ParE
MENKSGYSSIISTRAQKEIAVSWEWYEERQQGLGDRFVKEIVARLRDIEKNPDKYPTRYKSYKEASLPIFPFILIYRVAKGKKTIRLLSVFHTSRNPKKKYS